MTVRQMVENKIKKQRLLAGASVENIIACYEGATEFEKEYGEMWYDLAQASLLALHPEVPLWKSAGICAALSPNIAWGTNLKAVGKVLTAHKLGLTADQYAIAGYLSNRVKAFAIAGLVDTLSDSEAQTAIMGILSAKVDGAPKVKAFFRNLIGEHTTVTVDTHAASLAAGARITVHKMSITPKDSRVIGAMYHEAAEILDVEPAILQAVTWVSYRHTHKIASVEQTQAFFRECCERAGI